MPPMIGSRLPQLVVKRGRAKPLWHGHPWVYQQAVARVDEGLAPGEIVDVVDHRGRFIGRGPLHPGSAIAARIFTRDADESLDARWLARRLERALARRRLCGLPSRATSCYRLVNSEGDELSGLVVDVYGEAVALQYNGIGIFRWAAALPQLLRELLPLRAVVQVAPGRFAAAEGVEATPRLILGDSARAPCREHGLQLEVDLLAGQKTGLFLDQRANHARVGGWTERLARAAGRPPQVLDIYCYAGGFALAAARAGGVVTAVDSSARALRAAQANAAANGLAVELVESDAFRFLAARPAASADLVVLDPPAFTRARRDLPAALKGYAKLHRLALATLRPGGLLCSACCTQLVALRELTRLIGRVAREAGRSATLLEHAGAPEDHPRPPAFEEGDYLKFLVLEVR